MALRFARHRTEGGGVSIIAAAPKDQLERVLGPLTDEQYREHVLERNGLTEADVTELPEDWTAPDDRTFRGAWRLGGGKIDVDLAKARDLARDRIRVRRADRFPSLDAEALRAMETGDQATLAGVAARKTRLRDAPADARLDEARSPRALKTAMEAIIGEIEKV